jgi:hypothetical protein
MSTLFKYLQPADTQGCQRVHFQTKNRNLGTFWRVLQWKMLVYFMDIWSILLQFDKVYVHLVYFVLILYIFPMVWYIVPRKIRQPWTRDKRCDDSVKEGVFIAGGKLIVFIIKLLPFVFLGKL